MCNAEGALHFSTVSGLHIGHKLSMHKLRLTSLQRIMRFFLVNLTTIEIRASSEIETTQQSKYTRLLNLCAEAILHQIPTKFLLEVSHCDCSLALGM